MHTACSEAKTFRTAQRNTLYFKTHSSALPPPKVLRFSRQLKEKHNKNYLLTYSTEQSPSWEANRFSASQEIPRILWKPKIHHRIHKCPPPVPILSQINLLCEWLATDTFLQWGFVSTSPKPQTGGPPRVGCSRLLIQYIRSYPPYWRPFLHPQPEEAPCRGDRDQLIMAVLLST